LLKALVTGYGFYPFIRNGVENAGSNPVRGSILGFI